MKSPTSRVAMSGFSAKARATSRAGKNSTGSPDRRHPSVVSHVHDTWEGYGFPIAMTSAPLAGISRMSSVRLSQIYKYILIDNISGFKRFPVEVMSEVARDPPGGLPPDP